MLIVLVEQVTMAWALLQQEAASHMPQTAGLQAFITNFISTVQRLL